MKGIIIYESKYGATEEYAKWIGEETGFEILSVKKTANLEKYDVVILGSWIMAEKPKIAKWAVKNQSKLKGKKLVLFTTSGADKNEKILIDGFNSSFPEELRNRIKYFPLNGRIIINKLNWIDRQLMKLAVKIVAKKDPEKAMQMGKDSDKVDRDDIKPIIKYIKEKI